MCANTDSRGGAHQRLLRGERVDARVRSFEPALRSALLAFVKTHMEDYAREDRSTFRDFFVAFYGLPAVQKYVTDGTTAWRC